jgi:membrane-bound serine protease (ClpP class)
VSIFLGAIRQASAMNKTVLRLVWLFAVGVLLSALLTERSAGAEPARRYKRGVLIRFEGVVLPPLERYLNRKLDEARKKGADLVIVEIDSPGGMLLPAQNLATRLCETDWARTVAYIPNEALSAAAIMALGCDEIVMGPRARLGDAAPVVIGEDAQFRHAPEKIRSHLVRVVRDLATAKGRPPALAEAMVDMNVVVYRVVNKETGQTTFMSQPEIDSSANPRDWEKQQPVLESRENVFLEVNGQRAVELQLAVAAVGNRDELATRYALDEPLLIVRRDGVEKTVEILNLPIVTGVLLVIGLIALYVELSTPGIGFGGLTCGLCLTLFFWSRFLGGTAGWLEVILVVAGAVFLAVELFVIPGFGITGVTGLLLILAGLVMASQTHLIPQTPRALSQLGLSVLVVVASGMTSLVAAMFLSRYCGSLPILKQLVLKAPSAREDKEAGEKEGPPSETSTRMKVGVGDWGVAESPLRPAGKAIFGDEYVDVITDGSFVDAGSQVRVIRITGNHIVVREIDE